MLTRLGGYFDPKPSSSKAYVGKDGEGSDEQDDGVASSSSGDTRVGAVFSFKEDVVTSRVGISWISNKQACENVQKEIPEGTSLETVVHDAESEWTSKVLSKVSTTNTNKTTLSLLYSSLYFMHLIPTNQTGENPGWTSSEPYYQDIFTFWVHPLLCHNPSPYTTNLTSTGSLPLLHLSLPHPSTQNLHRLPPFPHRHRQARRLPARRAIFELQRSQPRRFQRRQHPRRRLRQRRT